MGSLHVDVLKEISSMGTGRAIEALSIYTNMRIEMEVPQVRFLEFKDVAGCICPPEDLIVGLLVPTEGDVSSMVMFLLDLNSARTILNFFYPTPKPADEEFNAMDIESLQEVGNIMISSYISALASLINKKINYTAPSVSIDMAGAILSVPAIKFSEISDVALHIETVFNAGEYKVTGFFLLVPDANSFKTIMESLGVM
jgi:chemotaxis protein CheC